MSPNRDTSARRLWALIGIGVAGLAAILVIPGPRFEPYQAPPDPAVEVTASMTPPKLLNYDEMLAREGRQTQNVAGTVDFRLRIDEEGRVTRWRPVSGGGPVVSIAERLVPYHEYAPALDETGRPVPVWWRVTVSIPSPMTLAREGTEQGPAFPAKPIPRGGYRIAELEAGKPVFTPLDSLPKLLNPDDVARAVAATMAAAPDFRESDGSVFFLLDRDGRVRRIEREYVSGTSAEIESVMAIARLHRFSPALDEGKTVPVWVRVWIRMRRG